MKNQYVGDIGDYGKYALLKAFAEADVKVGVNWYLTDDDESNDGKFIEYLNKPDIYRHYCPTVFDLLHDVVKSNSKSVNIIEKSGIINDAVFFNALMSFCGTPKERIIQRKDWSDRALDKLYSAELVFYDPDNGLLQKGDATKRGAEKYALPEEILDMYRAGHNVVYYCHKGRRTIEQWEEYKKAIFRAIPYASSIVLTFHKGTQRSYIFVIHSKDYEKYSSIVSSFMNSWDGIFTAEKVDMYMYKDIRNRLNDLLKKEYIIDTELYDFLYDNNLVVANYGEYSSTHPISVDRELSKIDDADFELCCVLITMILREDHFNNGSYDRRFEEGYVKRILDRMNFIFECFE